MWNTAVIHTLSLNSCVGMHPYTLQTCSWIGLEPMTALRIRAIFPLNYQEINMVARVGFEPTSSEIWVQLCYITPPCYIWERGLDSNQRTLAYEASEMPTSPPRSIILLIREYQIWKPSATTRQLLINYIINPVMVVLTILHLINSFWQTLY